MTERPPLSRRRLRMWIRMLRLTRGTENHLREFLRVKYDTTLPRFDVAAALYRADAPMKMSDLSQQLLVSNGNATVVVERLEKDGHARRVQGTEDKRVVLVELTDAGRAWFREVASAHEAEIDRLFASMDHDNIDTTRDLLRLMEKTNDDQLS